MNGGCGVHGIGVITVVFALVFLTAPPPWR